MGSKTKRDLLSECLVVLQQEGLHADLQGEVVEHLCEPVEEQPESEPAVQVPGALLLTELNEECEQLQREIDRLKSQPSPQVPDEWVTALKDALYFVDCNTVDGEEFMARVERLMTAAPSIAEKEESK